MDYEVFSLAWPSILSELSTPLLGAVDTLVVGHLSDVSDLSGVALATAVMNPLLFIFNFLRMSTGGLTARALGAEDAREILAILLRSLCVAVGIGLCLIAFQMPLAMLGFGFVHPPDAATTDRALLYFRARILGAPAALSNFALQAWLNAVKYPKNLLAMTLVLNVTNMVLCIWFAWFLGYGVAGVGFATALANYVALLFGAFQVWRIYPLLPCVAKTPAEERRVTLGFLLDRSKVIKLLVVQGNVFLRSVFLMTLITTFNAYSAALGTVPLAANNLLMQLQMFLSYGSDGFANAAQALIGKAAGQRSVEEARAAALAVARWSLFVIMVYTVMYVACGRLILESLTWHTRIVDYAATYLPFQWIAPLVSVAAYILDGVFVGANCYRDMRDANFFGMLAFLLVTIAWKGSNVGLWVAYLLHLIVRALVLLWKYPKLEKYVQGDTESAKPLLLGGSE
eukprot:TRINITY_DN26889_c0_g1_i1.p1 TRINITY_DN26889_c0_g1~~TRINITY_DN26889_c0_g1_i1.p1  ORF type:complete len:455 (-),score=107.25 TRINITY_DN26889_c0_g1_i1:160-1524(-)